MNIAILKDSEKIAENIFSKKLLNEQSETLNKSMKNVINISNISTGKLKAASIKLKLY